MTTKLNDYAKEELQHADETLLEMLKDVSNMTVAQVREARSSVVYSAIHEFYHNTPNDESKLTIMSDFVEDLLQSVDMIIAKETFFGD